MELQQNDKGVGLLPGEGAKECVSLAWDLIGDIHGHAEELRSLLGMLGYVRIHGHFSHPEGRRVIFLGDYVDRGPRIREVLEIVRGMVEADSALAILETMRSMPCDFMPSGNRASPCCRILRARFGKCRQLSTNFPIWMRSVSGCDGSPACRSSLKETGCGRSTLAGMRRQWRTCGRSALSTGRLWRYTVFAEIGSRRFFGASYQVRKECCPPGFETKPSTEPCGGNFGLDGGMISGG